MKDPTQVRNQAALTTSRGKSWLIMGGLFAVVCVAVFIPLLSYEPPGAAVSAIIAVVVLYAAMVAVRLLVPQGKRRLVWLAIVMGCIPVVTLAFLFVIIAAESPR